MEMFEKFDFEWIIEDDFVKNNLRFLLEDEQEDIKKCNQNNFENLCITYQSSKFDTDLSIIWSSSGSITCCKEVPSNFVNVLAQDFNISPQFKIDRISKEKKSNITASTILNDLESASTSTPKRNLKSNVPFKDTTNFQTAFIDKENLDPQKDKLDTFCKFCFKNGEPYKVYKSHVAKKLDGTTLCPILRKYVCQYCGATGDNAHTKKYCPLNIPVEIQRRPFRRLANGVAVSYHNHK